MSNQAAAVHFPKDLKYRTIDEVAECLSISRELCARLWSLMPSNVPADSEWPEPDSASRKARYLSKVWSDLTDGERNEIIAAAKTDHWIDEA